MPIIPIILEIPPKGMDGWEFSDGVGQVIGRAGRFGRKRRSSEERRERFW